MEALELYYTSLTYMYKKYFKIISLILIIISVSSCGKSGKFNRVLWDDGDGIDFPYREKIVDDLLKTHHLEGQKLKSVTDTLGVPQGRKKDNVYYDIDIQWDDKAKPEHIKRLIIYFGPDSVVTRTHVYEFFARKKNK
jgi:hypothetical protein